MNNETVKIFSDLLIDEDYCLLYNGNFIDAVTSKIINITKVSLIQRGDLIKTQNRFSYFIAECFQNIIRHGGHKEHDFAVDPLPGFFMAKIRNSFYDLVTGNLIINTAIPPLKKQFDDLNALDEAELRALYKKTMTEGQLSEKGGAGLGVIDMARKSIQKLEYKFLNQDDINSMFYFKVVMSSDSEVKNREGVDNRLEFGIDIHNKMIEQNVLILQKSDFSRNSVLPMLEVVKRNITSEDIEENLIKNIYQILVELIHNINQKGFRHEEEKEGIFLISKQDNSYQICSGNYINIGEKSYLNRFIKEVNSGAIDDLDRLGLSNLNPLKEKGVNIGKLIADCFCFDLVKIDDKALFLAIKATI